MAHTFEELVTLQRTADEAHAKVQQLQVEYGRTSTSDWTDEQHGAWLAAWKEWVQAAGDVQTAVSEHATEQGAGRNQVEADVKKAARHPAPQE
ncbi:hypothetical protein ACFY74_11825 [Streptomyces massasporeus]|uniref:hypothetical protein n=1 Tax=Streptomyces massasporeus TaxID=67324 RepID=UPI003689F97E